METIDTAAKTKHIINHMLMFIEKHFNKNFIICQTLRQGQNRYAFFKYNKGKKYNEYKAVRKKEELDIKINC
jgi:hypothetical protein